MHLLVLVLLLLVLVELLLAISLLPAACVLDMLAAVSHVLPPVAAARSLLTRITQRCVRYTSMDKVQQCR